MSAQPRQKNFTGALGSGVPFPLALLAGLLCLALVGGCRSAEGQQRDERIELAFWTANLSTFEPYIQGLIESFEAAHPEVRLRWLDLPQDVLRRRLMAAVAAGEPPQLVNLDTEFALMMAQQGALVELTAMVTPEQRDRYYPNLWRAAGYDEGVFAVPWYVSTRVVMFHKPLLREAGLDPESPPTSWEELDRQALQVSRRTSGVGMMPSIRLVNDWAMTGSPVVDPETLEPGFPSPETLGVLQRYCDLYREGAMPPETLTEGYRGALDRYKAGRLAFLEAGPQFRPRIRDEAPSVYAETGIAALPPSRTGEVPAATMNFAIPRSAEHREWALELALHLTGPRAQLELCRLVPVLPSTVESAEDPFFRDPGPDPLLAQAVEISLRQLRSAQDFTLALPRQKDLSRALSTETERAIRGEISAREALERAAEQWRAILAPFAPQARRDGAGLWAV